MANKTKVIIWVVINLLFQFVAIYLIGRGSDLAEIGQFNKYYFIWGCVLIVVPYAMVLLGTQIYLIICLIRRHLRK